MKKPLKKKKTLLNIKTAYYLSRQESINIDEREQSMNTSWFSL